jgi:hypothetical protein
MHKVRRTAVLAYTSALLCAIAVVFNLMNIRVGPLTSGVLIAAALLCLSLHLAGVGSRSRDGSRERDRAASGVRRRG